MDIFEINNGVVRPTPEILMVKPFGKIWDRDNSKKKSRALQEFAFINAMCSKKKTNPFQGYGEDVKQQRVIEAIIKEKSWMPDEEVKQAMSWYEEWQDDASTSMRYYKANKTALEKTIQYLTEELDYAERNNSGMPVHKFTDVVRGIKEADQVLKSINSLKTKVEQELFEAAKTKGDKDINHYER